MVFLDVFGLSPQTRTVPVNGSTLFFRAVAYVNGRAASRFQDVCACVCVCVSDFCMP